MRIETRFDIGATVYRIGREMVDNSFACPAQGCNYGRVEATVPGGATTSIACPHCGGRGRIGGRDFEIFAPQGTGVVGQVSVRVVDPEFLRQTANEAPSEATYMLRETGVGSGRVWYSGTLAATEQEAQVECDRLNKGAIVCERGHRYFRLDERGRIQDECWRCLREDAQAEAEALAAREEADECLA